MQGSAIKHPLPLETEIEAEMPQCPCKGAATRKIVGVIKKVIVNQSGIWYYTSAGVTVKAANVTKTL